MDNIQHLVEKLNVFLEIDALDEEQFVNSLDQILNLRSHKVRLRLINIEHYKERMAFYIKEKIDAVDAQRFEFAASCRDKEKEYLKQIELMAEYNIEKSTFYYEQGTLFYFYLGTAKNDKVIKGLLKE